jgi:dUTPase
MKVTFSKLHTDAIVPTNFLLHAYLISNTGRSNTCLIPPRTTRLLATGLNVQLPTNHTLYAITHTDILKHSLFIPEPFILPGEIIIPLYNGSHETYYVRHEELIAYIALLPLTQMTVEELNGNQDSATKRPQALHN